MSWRKTSSSVGVRRVRLTTVRPGVMEGEGDGAHDRGAVGGVHGDLVTGADHLVHARAPTAGLEGRRSVRLSTRATMTSVPTVRLSASGVPSATRRPLEMMPTRSASSSASSRYWVVRKMVVPCCR